MLAHLCARVAVRRGPRTTFSTCRPSRNPLYTTTTKRRRALKTLVGGQHPGSPGAAAPPSTSSKVMQKKGWWGGRGWGSSAFMHGPDVRFSWHFFCITFAGIRQDSCRSFNYLERACPSLFAFERKFASFLGAHIPLPNCISQRLSQRLYLSSPRRAAQRRAQRTWRVRRQPQQRRQPHRQRYERRFVVAGAGR